MLDPLKQFEIVNLFYFDIHGKYSCTNAMLSFMISYLMILISCNMITINKSLTPTRSQIIAETLFNNISNIICNIAGYQAAKLTPVVLSLFLFIAFNNSIGMLPFLWCPTTHFSVTFSISMMVSAIYITIGIINYRVRFFKIFVPENIPMFFLPIMIIIEISTHLMRPVSLSVRLASNMIAGHVIMKVIAHFVVLSGGIIGILPFTLLTISCFFEMMVGLLQAYIFTILTCVYLKDAYNIH